MQPKLGAKILPWFPPTNWTAFLARISGQKHSISSRNFRPKAQHFQPKFWPGFPHKRHSIFNPAFRPKFHSNFSQKKTYLFAPISSLPFFWIDPIHSIPSRIRTYCDWACRRSRPEINHKNDNSAGLPPSKESCTKRKKPTANLKIQTNVPATKITFFTVSVPSTSTSPGPGPRPGSRPGPGPLGSSGRHRSAPFSLKKKNQKNQKSIHKIKPNQSNRLPRRRQSPPGSHRFRQTVAAVTSSGDDGPAAAPGPGRSRHAPIRPTAQIGRAHV